MTSTYEYGIDVEAVDAVDFHTHVEIDSSGHCAYDDELAAATGRYFGLGSDVQPVLVARRRTLPGCEAR